MQPDQIALEMKMPYRVAFSGCIGVAVSVAMVAGTVAYASNPLEIDKPELFVLTAPGSGVAVQAVQNTVTEEVITVVSPTQNGPFGRASTSV